MRLILATFAAILTAMLAVPGQAQSPDQDQAEEAAAQLCRAVSAQPFTLRRSGLLVSVTISIGLAMSRPQQRLATDDLVEQADTALYRAKARGRNMVTVCRTAA